jgi:uncharacterized damage-inducible protein DinB
MPISQALLPEFDQEMSKARVTLARVPSDKFAWKPHPKSMTMGRLATHVAEIPGWIIPTIEKDELDLAPPGQPPFQPVTVNTTEETLAMFDKNVAGARAQLAGASDEHLMKVWSLLMTGKAIFSMPRVAVIRGMVMNHLIHHRAQLGVYLRLNDIPVPATYGPSADEGSM